MSLTPHLFLIRHGETEWSLTGQHTGRTDIALTEQGKMQADELGQRLRGIDFDEVLTSPLIRARETCERAVPDSRCESEPDLAEWDYGDYEGKTSAEICVQRPDWEVFRDGCPNGESPAHISARIDRLIARLRHKQGNIALFSHGHVGAALAARWIDLPLFEARHLALDVASVSILAFDSRHAEVAVIALWNGVSLQRFTASSGIPKVR